MSAPSRQPAKDTVRFPARQRDNRLRQELAIRCSVSLLIFAFNEAFGIGSAGGANPVIRVATLLALGLNGPYYLAARTGRGLRLQAYVRMYLDIAIITLGLYGAGGVAAAPYVGLYAITSVYVGLVLSSTASLFATGTATACYLAVALAQYSGWLPTPRTAITNVWTVAFFNLLILNIVGGLTAILAEAYRQSRRRLATLYGDLERANDGLVRLNSELEQRVIERTRELEVANKELEAFTYTVSHDLKAPLRGMDGFARAIQEEYADRFDDTGRRYLGMIQTSARRMGELIDDLLHYSRVERRELRRERVLLRPLLERVCEEFGEETHALGLTVRMELAVEAVEGEREGLREALLNLVGNAVKFRREGGGSVTISSRRDGNTVVLSVADDGIGFDMKYHDRIFNIFERLHRDEEYPGTGVGLAIVRKVAERHGGRAWAESEPGKGSTFLLALPAERGDV